jgi:methionine-rich copper-binding protein CopC
MYLRMICLMLFIVSATSCAHNDLITEKYAVSMATDIMYEKARLNAVDAICGQPGYVECMNESEQKCRMELVRFRQDCYDKSVAKMAKPLDLDNYQEFISYHMTCLMLNHSLATGAFALHGPECLEKLEMDEKKLLSEMFK